MFSKGKVHVRGIDGKFDPPVDCTAGTHQGGIDNCPNSYGEVGVRLYITPNGLFNVYLDLPFKEAEDLIVSLQTSIRVARDHAEVLDAVSNL